MVEFPCDLPCLLQFIRAEKRVQRGVNLDAKLMGIVAKLVDVLHGIACGSPCSEARGTDVDGVRAMVDGCDAAFEVAGRGKKLNIIQNSK